MLGDSQKVKAADSGSAIPRFNSWGPQPTLSGTCAVRCLNLLGISPIVNPDSFEIAQVSGQVRGSDCTD
jgi:hypothetical protein